ncbi:MAG: hypothetical protein ACMUIM_04455 [bacterium]
MLETLISILLLGLIVVGSFYSYSFVHQRILSQRQQRIVLGVMQGWMEKTSSYILSNEATDDLTDPNVQIGIENSFRQQFRDDVSTLFTPGISIDPNIDLNSIDNDLIEIRIWATLNGMPIYLYTELYTD